MMNLQATELKALRKTLALWHIADFKLADEVCQLDEKKKSWEKSIETDNAMLEKLANGESGVVQSEEEIRAHIRTCENMVANLKAAYNSKKEECDKDLTQGYALVTDALMDSIKAYISDIFSEKAESDLLNALVKWFSDNGAKDADIESVKPYIRALGQKPNTAKGKAKTNTHNKIDTNTNLKKTFLGAICDEPKMAKVLGPHKWVTIIEKKTK